MNGMKILVTGATGFTGQRVLPLLVQKEEIRCFVRRNGNSKGIEKFGYELSYGDLSDLESLKRAMSGCDVLINVASLGFGHAPGIVKTAEEAGIRRAIFVSTTALFTQLNATSKSVRRQAEDCIRGSGLYWTILRPTMIYGAPGDRNMIRLIMLLDSSPLIPIFGTGNNLQQPVHVEDVVKSIIAVLFHEDTIHNEFNLSGKSPHTYDEIVDLTAKALGKRVLKVHLPLKPSMYVMMLYERICSKPFLKSEQVMRLNENKNFDHSPAQKAFGYNPISFEQGITREVSLYRQLKDH